MALSPYDTRRRLETLIDEFLTDEMIEGKTALDVGCGLGFFTQRLTERGAQVIACDIGPGLVEKTRIRTGCEARVADALGLAEHFGRNRFDLVLSSECIEHVPAPDVALQQMVAVLKPGGYLSVSTPNSFWYPVVRAATKFGLRPFDGHENFMNWSTLREVLNRADIQVLKERGLHLFPFQLGLHGFSSWCDRRLQAWRGLMINMCILGRKMERAPAEQAMLGAPPLD